MHKIEHHENNKSFEATNQEEGIIHTSRSAHAVTSAGRVRSRPRGARLLAHLFGRWEMKKVGRGT